GLRVVAHRPPTWKGGFKHDFYESNEEVVLRTRQINESGRDAWFGLASFATNTSREATNTVALQTLWIDLDYKQYESVEEAHDALARLYTVVGYPSIRVQSGGGLHAYWVLRHALPTAEWKPLA